MSEPNKKISRKAIRRPFKTVEAPAIAKGLPVQKSEELLKNATPDQIRALTYTNLALWAAYSDIRVDGRKFEFDTHRYLLPIYMDEGQEITWMKAAQLGATVFMLLRLLWLCRTRTLKCALYFPTGDGVKLISKDRLNPLINSNAELSTNVSEDGDTLSLKRITNIEGNESSMYMLYLGGKSTKDSTPLDAVAFDEVRLVDESDIDQAIERLSHSKYKHKVYMSTAGLPNLDIHRRFLRGTQMTWHVKCNCRDGFVPSDVFPECIADTGKEVYLRCPKCNMRIRNPQNGSYVPHNPSADFNSYSVSQLISQYISPKEIWEFYQRTTNKSEFFNAKLGKPYVDEENQPVTEAVLENCIDENLRWATSPSAKKDRKRNCAMGVDQHSGNCYVVIGKPGPDGVKELVHVEIIESGNPTYWVDGKPVSPFRRCEELIDEYDVGMCVVDAMPNINEAQAFARKFPGRVFIGWYKDGSHDMVQWTDRMKPKEAIRRGSKNIRMKWQVLLKRYDSMDFSLSHYADRAIRMPHPDDLIQVVRDKDSGRFVGENIVRTRLWVHLRSMVRFKNVIDEETGRFKMDWVKIGDDHFAHANNYFCIACERLKRRPVFVL